MSRHELLSVRECVFYGVRPWIMKSERTGTMASRLFEETKINVLKLANRFVRSATWEGLASENGACTPRLSQLMGELARGSVGLIISSHTYVRGDGQAGPWQLGIYEQILDKLNRCKAALETLH